MNLWDKKDVPHKGWKCIDMIDLCEDIDDIDYETRRLEIYKQCEMCGQEGVRYIHVMEHPDCKYHLNVGLVCAEKMENEYAPTRREAALKNRNLRRKRFLQKEWLKNSKGNLVLHYKGDYITIMPDKYRPNQYCIAYGGKFYNEYKGEKVKDLHIAKLVAFEIFDGEL